MNTSAALNRLLVDCRIGSLETMLPKQTIRNEVDCRIGSLEMLAQMREDRPVVDCRIGSLEIT